MPPRKAADAAVAVPDWQSHLKKADISPNTLKIYLDRLSVLTRAMDAPLHEWVADAKASIRTIQKRYDAIASQKAYLAVVLSLFRYVPNLKCELPDAHAAWFDAFSKVDKAITERYKTNEPSDKQKAGYVPFDQLVSKRNGLPKGSEDRLLLGMYTHIPPMRADFNHVRFYTDRLPKDAGPNYIFTRKGECVLHLGEYKTAKSHGDYEKVLPDALCEEIHASLDKHPRDYLFVTAAGRPFDKPNSYIKHANRSLARIFGRPLTLSLLRHSFIDQLDFNTLTIAEKEAIATDMGHTTKLQDMYRLIFK